MLIREAPSGNYVEVPMKRTKIIKLPNGGIPYLGEIIDPTGGDFPQGTFRHYFVNDFLIEVVLNKDDQIKLDCQFDLWHNKTTALFSTLEVCMKKKSEPDSSWIVLCTELKELSASNGTTYKGAPFYTACAAIIDSSEAYQFTFRTNASGSGYSVRTGDRTYFLSLEAI